MYVEEIIKACDLCLKIESGQHRERNKTQMDPQEQKNLNKRLCKSNAQFSQVGKQESDPVCVGLAGNQDLTSLH